MASTNNTKNLGLSQWLATDKPSWLNDVNVDLEKIDEFAGEVEQNQVETVGKINQVNATIEDMQKEVTANRDSITATEERITEVEKDTANLQISVNKLNTDYSGIENTVSQVEQTTEQLNTRVDDAEKQISVNTTNVTNTINRLGEVETKIAVHASNINAINTTIGDWDDVYEASTITEKVQELEQGGGSGSDVNFIAECVKVFNAQPSTSLFNSNVTNPYVFNYPVIFTKEEALGSISDIRVKLPYGEHFINASENISANTKHSVIGVNGNLMGFLRLRANKIPTSGTLNEIVVEAPSSGLSIFVAALNLNVSPPTYQQTQLYGSPSSSQNIKVFGGFNLKPFTSNPDYYYCECRIYLTTMSGEQVATLSSLEGATDVLILPSHRLS